MVPPSSRSRRPLPREVRFRLSERDESVRRWLAEQESVRTSVRLLIIEAIERDGYTDRQYPHVDIKPRVGRPPRTAATPAAEVSEEAPASDAAHDLDVVAVQAPPQQAPVAPAPGSGSDDGAWDDLSTVFKKD